MLLSHKKQFKLLMAFFARTFSSRSLLDVVVFFGVYIKGKK